LYENKYDYSNVIYLNNRTNIKIVCPIHGEFNKTPYEHSLGSGCQKCKSSSGEKTIRKKLKKLNIFFIEQYRFYDCRNKNPLPFDFYLPEYKICIEYDGEQHFSSKWLGENSLTKTKENDIIKNNYCRENNINLIRIPYTEKEKIGEILNEGFEKDREE
jgi:hypothetical protein